jgi:hypothetical protein
MPASPAIFSPVRISLRSCEFFGDTPDHEFERLVKRAPKLDFVSGKGYFN